MANQQSLSGLSKFGDLKKRLVFLLGALVVFRIGAHIPVPGVDAVALANLFQGARDGIFGMLNMFSGGSLERFTIFCYWHYALYFVIDYCTACFRDYPFFESFKKKKERLAGK